MKSIPFALALVAGLCSPAQGATLYRGDFSETGFTANNDTPWAGSDIFSVNAANGVVTLSKPETYETGIKWVVPHYQASGDFRQDVSMNFLNVQNGPFGGLLSGVSVNFGGYENSSQVAAGISAGGQAFLSYSFLSNGETVHAGSVQVSNPAATILRVERIGNVVSQYLSLDGSNFGMLSTISGDQFTDNANFFLALQAYQPTEPSGSVDYSNFVVSDFGPSGTSAGEAQLPGTLSPQGGFVFDFFAQVGQTSFFDPLVATGYDFELSAGSPNIATALFPVLDGDSDGYTIYSLTDLDTPLFTHVMGGQLVDFTTLAGYENGISGFALRGIDLEAGLDPNDQTAFATGFSFATSGNGRLTQTPISAETGVPEPASWAMMIAGFGLLGAALRRRSPVHLFASV